MRTLAALTLAGAGLAGCVVAPIPLGSRTQTTTTTTQVPAAGTVPAGSQYLYASGEAAAIDRQVWGGVISFAAAAIRNRPRDSVVLAEGATLMNARFVPCGAKPFAAVFDVDETVLLNRGFEYDAAMGQPYSEARWRAYELTGGTTAVALPGAKAALDRLRALGVTVVFNTNRSAANAAATMAVLERNGLGPAVHGRTLYVMGDEGGGSGKDARRAWIARDYCVIAMAGDQLGDFSDLFNAGQAPASRRAATEAPGVARLWGAGWFVLPNPVYGSALKGDLDAVFPPDARWAPEP